IVRILLLSSKRRLTDGFSSAHAGKRWSTEDRPRSHVMPRLASCLLTELYSPTLPTSLQLRSAGWRGASKSTADETSTRCYRRFFFGRGDARLGCGGNLAGCNFRTPSDGLAN